jgi:beta-lactamase class A
VLADLEYELRRIASGVAADWSIYIRYTSTGEEIAIDADRLVDTMSVIKVPLLVTLFRAVEAGAADLDHRIMLEARHKRFGTGVLSTLDDGLVLSLRDAAMLMIIQSDNTATDLCFEAVGGPEAVTRAMCELGLPSIQALGTAFDWFRALAMSMDPTLGTLSPGELFRRGYPDLSPRELASAREAFHFGGQHPFALATPREIGRLLEMLWDAECAGPVACREMLRILRLQQFRSRMPKYLFGASVAHKTGDFDPFIANDVGIVQPAGLPPIIVCFFSARHRGIWAHLEDTVARMSEKVYDYALARNVGAAAHS